MSAPVLNDRELTRYVRRIGDRLHLQTLAMRSSTGTVRWVDTTVRIDRFKQ